MNEHVRSLGSNGKGDIKTRAREVIYDMAVIGKPFTVYDVIEHLGDGTAGSQDAIGHALRSARLVGIVVENGNKMQRVPLSPEDWIAGKHPVNRRVKIYQGSPKLLSSKERSK